MNKGMIRHIVFFSAKNKDDLPAIHEGLMNLTRIAADLNKDFFIEIAYNEKADQIGNDCDIVVYGEFQTLYIHRAAVARNPHGSGYYYSRP